MRERGEEEGGGGGGEGEEGGGGRAPEVLEEICCFICGEKSVLVERVCMCVWPAGTL